jgi:hypothetical protein
MKEGEHLRTRAEGKQAASPGEEWRQPVLRKLPIAATATSKGGGNEGDGQGKGDANARS